MTRCRNDIVLTCVKVTTESRSKDISENVLYRIQRKTEIRYTFRQERYRKTELRVDQVIEDRVRNNLELD